MSTSYTADGRIVRVVGVGAGDRPVVEYGRQHNDGEISFHGDVAIVDRVFDDPPTEALHRNVAALEQREAETRARLSELQTQLARAETTHKERMVKLRRYEGLQLIEDFVDGKLSHYVLVDDQYSGWTRIRISTPQEQFCNDETRSYSRKLKLLWLFGDPQSGNVEWRLNRYSDGSGHQHTLVFPFTSLEAARTKALELLDKAFAIAREKPNLVDEAIASAKALQVDVPTDIIEVQLAHQRKTADSHVRKARSDLEAAEQKLAALGGSPQ